MRTRRPSVKIVTTVDLGLSENWDRPRGPISLVGYGGGAGAPADTTATAKEAAAEIAVEQDSTVAAPGAEGAAPMPLGALP